MAGPDEPAFDQDDVDDADDELDSLTEAFREVANQFSQEHDVPPAILSMLALELSLTTRMVDYVVSVEKPSGAGLKRELERFGREVEQLVRDARKRADEFVAGSREAIAQARAEENDE